MIKNSKWIFGILLILLLTGVSIAADRTVLLATEVSEAITNTDNAEVNHPVAIKHLRLSRSLYVYNGKAKTPKITVSDENGKNVPPKYYVVTYKNNTKVGTATVKAEIRQEYKGIYRGSLKETFTIDPPAAKIKQVIPQQFGFTVKWKKTDAKAITGYELAYATSSKFKKAKTITLTVKNNKTQIKIENLKGDKTYYVRMRTYRTVRGKTYYSKWSDSKSVTTKRFLVVIDAGHQSRANTGKEPNSPGSAQMKMKVTGGTRGNTTGLYEYELNLTVAKKLREILEKRGYEVRMVRTTNDVNITNIERAKIANEANADAFIRIHANSSTDTSIHGAMTICQTKHNKDNASLYKQSKQLSTSVLNHLVSQTGCKKNNVWETDTMTGINWCSVPVTIVEMGYMSNPTEDRKMASDSYQNKMATGIADGIDAYFGR